MSSVLTPHPQHAASSAPTSTRVVLTATWPLVGSSLVARIDCNSNQDAAQECDAQLLLQGDGRDGIQALSGSFSRLRWRVERGAGWTASRLIGFEVRGQVVQFELFEVDTASGGQQKVLLTNLPAVLGFPGGTYSQPLLR